MTSFIEIRSFSDEGKEIAKTVEKLWGQFSAEARETDTHFWAIPLVSEVGNQRMTISYRNDFIEKIPDEMPDSGVGLYLYVHGSTSINTPEVTCLLYRNEPYIRILGLKTSDLTRQDVVQNISGSELGDSDKSMIVNQIKTAISGEFRLDSE